MRRYYFDNSARVYSGKLVVIGEAAYRRMMDREDPGWMHHWLSGEFRNLEEAKGHFAKEWMDKNA